MTIHLQVNITLLTSDPDVVTSRMDEVRNKILMLLSYKKASQISSVAGKEELARDIVRRVNLLDSIKSLGVTEALFTSFLIQ